MSAALVVVLVAGFVTAMSSTPRAARRAASAATTPSTGPGPAGAVSVFPSPGSRTASPATQLSFRGIDADRVGQIEVTGSRSGHHPGRWVADSDGLGASFFPAEPFTPDETVHVHTSLPVRGASGGDYAFTVSHPVADAPPWGGPAPAGAKGTTKGTTTVAAYPSWRMPATRVLLDRTGNAAGDLFLAPKAGPGQPGPMILDAHGRLVWYHPLTGGISAYDFRPQTYDGHPVLTWWQGIIVKTGHGRGVDEIYDDTYQPVATVRAGNGYVADLHEFQLTGRDTALITAYQPVLWDLSSVGDPTVGPVLDGIVQEIDVRTGNVLFEWHSLDHVALGDSYATAPKALTPATFDYFHVNSVDEDRAGRILISGRATHAIYDVDHDTGDVLWTLGGKHSDFALGAGVAFHSQHDAKWLTPDTVTVFDNGAGVGTHEEPRSRALVIRLDVPARRATLVTADVLPGRVLAPSQGDVDVQPNGDLVVGWGQRPYLSEFAPTGALLFNLTMSGHSYRGYRAPWSGHPTARPAVVASVSGGDAFVDVAWNGADDVRGWRLLTGSDPSRLTPATTATATGFDTRIALPATAGYVAAQALDRNGHVLATTATTPIR